MDNESKKNKRKRKKKKTATQNVNFWDQLANSTKNPQNQNTSTIRLQLRPGVPSQNVRPVKPNQHIRPGNQKAPVRLPNPNQEQAIFPVRPETTFPENKPSQQIDMANPAKSTIPSNPGQPIGSANPGSGPLIRGPLRPRNPTLFFPPSLRDKIPFYQQQTLRMQQQAKGAGNSGQPNAEQLIATPDKGSQFTLQETLQTDSDKPTPLPKSTNQEINRDTNDNPVITLVGKNDKVQPLNQQKKILKFQMRLQAMQQEKQKQAQILQPITTPNEPKFINTFVSTETALPVDIFKTTGMPSNPANPGGMQNPSRMQNLSGMQIPSGMQNPSRMQNPGGMQNPIGVQNVSRLQNPARMPNTSTVQTLTGSGKSAPSRNTQPKTLISVPLTQPQPTVHVHPHPETVETVFSMDQDIAASIMSSTRKRMRGPTLEPWLPTVDQYGFKYPKGVPKSFLVQQATNPQPSESAAPIWPTYQPPVPMGQPHTSNPTTAGPLLVHTDSQDEVAQPYSPSELYTDLEQPINPGENFFLAKDARKILNNIHINTKRQDAEDLKKALSDATYIKRQIDYWSLKVDEALIEMKHKCQVWHDNGKPHDGPYYLDFYEARRILKGRRKHVNQLKKCYNKQREAIQKIRAQYEDSESSDISQSGQKRVSAFKRLGPQTQPKKPKLTISLTLNDDQEVREVVDETEEQEEITPVHLREDMMLSTDETVMKYLKSWPWKRNVVVKRSVTARNSKTVMMLEREQMEEIYDKETLFVQVSVKGYPPTWTKEQVLDLLMENIRGYSFIPCFIEFNREECKFLTLRCRSALLSLHKCGFIIRKEDIELIITLGQTELTLTQLDFVPRLILRKRLNMCVDGSKLDLTEFTLKEDISHFIYYPLNRLNNQSELVQVQSDVTWANITDLNLSHNRISCLDGFDLEQTMPNLKHLDLSYNCIEKLTYLIKFRPLPLKTIRLEGNPLCTDYTDPDHYIKVVKMMFSGLSSIDGIPVKLKGDMPKIIRNYCPSEATELVDKFLEVYFPLLDGDIEHRAMLQDMYEDHATMTVTYNYKMAFSPIYRCYKTLFQNARLLDQNKMDMIKGSTVIVKNIVSWPHTAHDPFTFTVDVLLHNDTTTIFRIDGILKLTRESLAEDEYLLAFSRTLVVHTRDFVEYKIQSEMIHWSIPIGAYARSAFAVTAVKTKQMNPKIDSTTDEKLQAELLKIFMKLTSMDKKVSERCLEIKKWNLKEALDHFTKLLRLDSLETLTNSDAPFTPPDTVSSLSRRDLNLKQLV